MMAINKQKGSFVIELAFVLMFLCLLTLFTADIAMQLFTRSKLDRVSYSLVNVLKERKRLYSSRYEITHSDYIGMKNIAEKLLDNQNIGLMIKGYDGNHQFSIDIFPQGKHQCKDIPLNKNLIPINTTNISKSVKFPVYQVTICQKYHSWFGLVTHGSKEFLIQSTSVIPGR